VPLMLCTVCCIMAGALILYYRSLGIASTLLRRDNNSGKPCMGVMTHKALSFSALKLLGNYRRLYTISLENPKNPLNGVLPEVMPTFWLLLEVHVYVH
jgi:hypothetical protein